RDDPHLFAYALAQRSSDLLLVRVNTLKHTRLILLKHHADVDAGNAEIGTDLHIGDSNKSIAEKSPLVLLEYLADLFLNQPGELMLAGGSCHKANIPRKDHSRSPWPGEVGLEILTQLFPYFKKPALI